MSKVKASEERRKFGKEIKYRLIDLELQQNEFSQMVKIRPQRLSQLIHGWSIPREEEIRKIEKEIGFIWTSLPSEKKEGMCKK